jgi:IMP dehydrogenase
MKALSFDDISLVPRYNNIASRRDVDTSVRFGNLTLRVPVLSSNMDTVTGHRMSRSIYDQGGLGFLHRFCSIEDNVTMYNDATFEWQNTRTPRQRDCEAVVSLGVNEGLDRFHALYEVGARYFCIDIAHGHSKPVGQMVQKIKEFDDGVFVIAGNVCHATGAEYLADKGADAVKVGIGPGSVCSTRIKTGFGVPQFTAIQECSRVNVFIIADGGIRTPGDAVKAFVAGADAVMLGGMLAGTDETPGEIHEQPIWESASPAGTLTRRFKKFRGMASKEAQDDFMGTMNDWKTAEGVETTVTAKGPVSAVIGDLIGGIRSGCTYCGANNIQQLKERAAYVEVTAAGRIEGTPHGQGKP